MTLKIGKSGKTDPCIYAICNSYYIGMRSESPLKQVTPRQLKAVQITKSVRSTTNLVKVVTYIYIASTFVLFF